MASFTYTLPDCGCCGGCLMCGCTVPSDLLVLHATIHNLSDSTCDCLDGLIVPLSGDSNQYTGGAQPRCTPAPGECGGANVYIMSLNLQQIDGVCVLTFGCDCVISAGDNIATLVSVSCDPFQLVFHGNLTIGTKSLCCPTSDGQTNPIEITITE